MSAIEVLLAQFAENMGFKFDPAAPSHVEAMRKTLSALPISRYEYKLTRNGMKTLFVLVSMYNDQDDYEIHGVTES